MTIILRYSIASTSELTNDLESVTTTDERSLCGSWASCLSKRWYSQCAKFPVSTRVVHDQFLDNLAHAILHFHASKFSVSHDVEVAGSVYGQRHYTVIGAAIASTLQLGVVRNRDAHFFMKMKISVHFSTLLNGSVTVTTETQLTLSPAVIMKI